MLTKPANESRSQDKPFRKLSAAGQCLGRSIRAKDANIYVCLSQGAKDEQLQRSAFYIV